MMLVSPDGSCYVINDTGPDGEDVAQLADRRPDLPSKRSNLEQMFGWKPSPHDVRRKVAEDWQLLQDVKWAECAGEFIPLVGSGANALKIFNQKRGTSHILDPSFRKFLSGTRPFDGGWRCRDGVRPGWLNDLVDGSSLLGPRPPALPRQQSTQDVQMSEVSPTCPMRAHRHAQTHADARPYTCALLRTQAAPLRPARTARTYRLWEDPNPNGRTPTPMARADAQPTSSGDLSPPAPPQVRDCAFEPEPPGPAAWETRAVNIPTLRVSALTRSPVTLQASAETVIDLITASDSTSMRLDVLQQARPGHDPHQLLDVLNAQSNIQNQIHTLRCAPGEIDAVSLMMMVESAGDEIVEEDMAMFVDSDSAIASCLAELEADPSYCVQSDQKRKKEASPVGSSPGAPQPHKRGRGGHQYAGHQYPDRKSVV